MAEIIAEALSPITHNQIPVITTELLAHLYGAEVNNLQQNFKRNQNRFVDGKHFFKIEGVELRELKNRLTDGQSVAKHTRSLILWTERGAARHAKMLETDQAWEVFEKLEDCYFNKKNELVAPIPQPLFIPTPINGEGEWVIQVSGNSVTHVCRVMPGEVVMSIPSFQEMMERVGNIIIPYQTLESLTSTEIVNLVTEAKKTHHHWNVIRRKACLSRG